LYSIEIGGNDIRDAIVAYPNGHGTILQCAVISIGANITRLYAAGARRFIVWRAPDVGLTPAMAILDKLKPGAKALASALTQAFNQGLDGAVAQLALLPDINVKRLDAFRLLHNIVETPQAFGLTNVVSACVTPNVPPFTCDAPDEFLFWDGIHPSTATHAIIASEAASVLLN
jgi:outer membrane lipase/esterase